MGGINALEARRRILLNTPHIETASGSIATFQTDMVGKLKECRIHFAPVQEGEGDPSPDNVRPITGWTGCEVTRCGANLLELTTSITRRIPGVTSSVSNQILTIDGNSSGEGNTQVICKIPPAWMSKQNQYFYWKQHIISGTGTKATGSFMWGLWNNQLSTIKRVGNGQRSFNYNIQTLRFLPFGSNVDGQYQIVIQALGNPAEFNNLTLAYSLSPSGYLDKFEPYQGTTIPIDWTEEAGTVYGGYVDLVKGEVVADWGYIASYNGENLPSNWISDRDVYVAGATPTIGAQVAYRLATPIHYPIDPITLKTLRGTNNIFANTNGNTEVKFYTH